MRKLILLFLVFCAISCKERKWEASYSEVVLVKKYSEQISTNRFGSFRTDYYFLYSDGELSNDISLRDYIEFEEGDTIIRTSYNIVNE